MAKITRRRLLGATAGIAAGSGAVGDGGGLHERMGHVACWNSVMNGSRYMIQRWNEFVAA